MTQKLIALIVLVIVALLSVAGCTSSTSSNQAAGNTSQAASTSASASASATPKAASTAVPTAAPVVPTTPTTPTAVPTAVSTATPTPAPVTAQVLILEKPASATAGSTVTIRFQVFNSVTTAGMPGVTVDINGAVNTQVITGTNGEGSFSFIAPQGGVGAHAEGLLVCSVSSVGNSAYWGSCMSADFTLITPPVGNATA
jgi:cytoskeletal protein RodZ